MVLSMPILMLDSPQDLIILLVLAVLLFGGSRLAGLGKGAGRALREFKEETSTLHDKAGAPADKPADAAIEAAPVTPATTVGAKPVDVVDAEVVTPHTTPSGPAA